MLCILFLALLVDPVPVFADLSYGLSKVKEQPAPTGIENTTNRQVLGGSRYALHLLMMFVLAGPTVLVG